LFIEKIFGKSSITEEELKRKIKSGKMENVHLELKREISDDVDHLLKPIVGLANGEGGILILGIDEDGNIVGIDKDSDWINNKIKDLIKPSLKDYNIVTVSTSLGKPVYLIDVASSTFLHAVKEKRYYVYYIRKGPSTRLY
jgi:ATP-dependent DNA helicase RecG